MCVHAYTGDSKAYDIKFFDEKIKEKLSRSRFAKQYTTPFLDNKDYNISHTFVVPAPAVTDLQQREMLFFFCIFFLKCLVFFGDVCTKK